MMGCQARLVTLLTGRQVQGLTLQTAVCRRREEATRRRNGAREEDTTGMQRQLRQTLAARHDYLPSRFRQCSVPAVGDSTPSLSPATHTHPVSTVLFPRRQKGERVRCTCQILRNGEGVGGYGCAQVKMPSSTFPTENKQTTVLGVFLGKTSVDMRAASGIGYQTKQSCRTRRFLCQTIEVMANDYLLLQEHSSREREPSYI